MEEVIKVLMERDGLDEAEAQEIYDDVMAEVNEAIDDGDPFEAEEIFVSHFGLECDYLLNAIL